MTKDVCEVTIVDEEKVTRVKEQLDEQRPAGAAQMFKALADETRVKIAYALSIENELCVCDVANIVGASEASASHHLRLLRKLGLATYRKVGKLAYYSLDDGHVEHLVRMAFEHALEKEGSPI